MIGIIPILGQVFLLGIAVGLKSEGAAEVSLSELDAVPLFEYEPYVVDRLRWGQLNQYSGYTSSGKLLKFKEMQTALGKLKVPVEDLSKLEDLSESEFLSVLTTKGTVSHEDDSFLGLELINEGEIKQGIEVLRNVLDSTAAKMGKHHILYANALADIAWGYYKQGSYNESYDLYSQAVEIEKKSVEQYSPRNYAATLNNMASVALARRDTNILTISKLFQESYEKLVEKKDSERFKPLLNIANLYRVSWLPIRAISMFKLARQNIPKTSPLYYDNYMYLGSTYMLRGEFQKAKTLLEVAKAFYEEHGLTNTNIYLQCLFEIANAEYGKGEFNLALTSYTAVHDILEKRDGKPTGRRGAILLTAIAQALAGRGDYAKAVILLESAESLSVNDSVSTSGAIDLKITHLLAKAYKAIGMDDKAKPKLETTVAMGTDLLGKDHDVVIEASEMLTLLS